MHKNVKSSTIPLPTVPVHTPHTLTSPEISPHTHKSRNLPTHSQVQKYPHTLTSPEISTHTHNGSDTEIMDGSAGWMRVGDAVDDLPDAVAASNLSSISCCEVVRTWLRWKEELSPGVLQRWSAVGGRGAEEERLPAEETGGGGQLEEIC